MLKKKNNTKLKYRGIIDGKVWHIILIDDDEYLYTNAFEFYYNSNSISYSNSN